MIINILKKFNNILSYFAQSSYAKTDLTKLNTGLAYIFLIHRKLREKKNL